MEEDHDFTEFENIETVYRRGLLPWWLWVLLLLYNSFTTIDVLNNAYGLTRGYVFAFDVVQLGLLVPYPVYPAVSVALWLFMLASFVMLWLEKKNAAVMALCCYGIMILLSLALLLKGFLKGQFWLRYEIIIFADLFLRLYTGRKKWENGLTRSERTLE